jgi:DNA-binding transcriptional ArsR family regulator
MDLATAVMALGALAQDTRLQAFRLLVQAGGEGRSAGVLAEALGVPPTTLSFHLSQLLRANLATQRRLGRQQFYAADYASMNDLLQFLTENCCGRGAACGPVCDPAAERREAP